MLSEHLLKILVCPETKLPVAPAPAELLEQINRSIHSGTLRNLAGNSIKDSVDGVLVRNDGKRAYLVRNDIPIMLIDESISLE